MSNPLLSNSMSLIGIWVRAMGTVTLDERFPQTVNWLRPIGEGDILYEGIDGLNYFYPAAQTKEWVPLLANKILSTGTDWEGEERTTTATDILWMISQGL